MLSFVKKSIRTKIFLSLLLPLAFVEILLLYLHINNINKEFVKIYKNAASTISAPFINSIVGKLEALDKVEDQKNFLEIYIDLKGEIEFPKWVSEYKKVLKIAFVSDSEKLLYETSDQTAINDLELNSLHTARSSNIRKDGNISILIPLYVKEIFMGNLVFWFSDSELKLEEKQALRLVGWVMIISMILGSLLAWLISSAITKPINQLTLDARSISSGDLGHKIFYLKSTDEIGTLARSFNSMRDSIRENLNEVNKKNADLFKEISDRRQAENQLSKFATVIEQADEEVVITDPDGTIQYINPSFEKNTGYKKNEVLGQKPSILKSGIHNSEFYKNLWSTILNKEIWKGTIHNKCKNDQLILHEMAITPILDSNKEISAFVSIRRDITDKTKIEQQMKQSQKMEAIGTLAGGIAHDFNNILSGIFGYSQLAKMHIDDTEKTTKNIDQVIKGAQKATDLVKQILTFSRKSEHKMQPLKIFIEVKEAIKLLRSSIPSTIEIKENITSKSTILADLTQIHQVVMNLCTNAYHAMREKGGILTVGLNETEISNTNDTADLNIKPGTYLKLEVSDTGFGMKPEMLNKIFEPYFTTKEIGEGTGLGLAVVLGIVDEHNGYIKAYSKPGKGTTFHVYFPVLEDQIDSNLLEKKQTIQGGAEKIMVVDDEQNILEITKEFLEDYGYTVSTFSDGEDAFKEFKKNPQQIDLIITDLTMPKMTGEELTCKILKIRNDLPIFLCTGYSENLTEEKALKLGIKKFIQKPVETDNLLALIREVLDRKTV